MDKGKKAPQGKKSSEILIKGYQTVPPLEGLSVNPNNPTHHADIINILFGSDGFALLSFFSRTPGCNVEECRVSVSHVLAKKIVDLLCRNLNYYPHDPAQPDKARRD